MAGHLRLTRDLSGPTPVPTWPEHVRLAPFSATLAPPVHALLLRAYAEGGGTVPAEFDAWWAMTRHDPEFDASLCFVAVAGNQPVGFALCWTTGFIKDLVVDPDWRGKGIGSALLLTAFAAFRDQGLREVSLKVLTDNMRARRLYARMGFRDDN